MKHTNAEVQNIVNQVKIKEHESARFFNWLSTAVMVLMLCVSFILSGTELDNSKLVANYITGLFIAVWAVLHIIETYHMIRLLRED